MIAPLAGFSPTRGCLLLDFDGPVCDIFAGLPNHVAASRLRRVLAGHSVPIPEQVVGDTDPLQVLRYTGAHHPQLVPEVEHELQRVELEAVEFAAPTPGAIDVMQAAPMLRLAIVSNNSAAAIVRNFQRHHSNDWPGGRPPFPIVGRDPSDPRLMKPHPHAVRAGIRATGSTPGDCVIVGDSTTDIQAARAAGVRSIGYANKPGKAARLLAADAIVTDMAELARELHAIHAAL